MTKLRPRSTIFINAMAFNSWIKRSKNPMEIPNLIQQVTNT